MLQKKILFSIFVLLITNHLFSQKDSTAVKEKTVKEKIEVPQGVYNPLSPSKAAFYSAILPGMGQIYNKKYWKAPIVWGVLGGTTYLYIDNNSIYKRYRTAFKLRKAGLQDEFTLIDAAGNTTVLISEAGLESAQKQLRENRDLALLSSVLVYVLQIVEASVNAHLLQFNTDDNLTFKPAVIPDNMNFANTAVGFNLKYQF
ncbi:MAG: DUF5683 domain-containing protein [Polaribacter sp.]|nr:DUF5683 domain-containing protein [Polaribacter sp.]MDC1375131.1 DUF5683 domain-containing protein [Polaribacter sp.]MDG1246107.1 DUF5683 domain-containing protein [Polaribacter sp.]MDG1320775.1 DUF5683 domain-containing protein [Polaribacter sp.]